MFIHSKTTAHHFSGTSWHSIFLYSNFWPLSTRTLINNKLPRPCSLLPHCQPASKVAFLLASLMPTCHTTLLWWSSRDWGNSGTSGGGTLFGLEVSMGAFASPGLFYNVATAIATALSRTVSDSRLISWHLYLLGLRIHRRITCLTHLVLVVNYIGVGIHLCVTGDQPSLQTQKIC